MDFATDAVYSPPGGISRVVQRFKWLTRFQGIPATVVTCGMQTLAKCGLDATRRDWYARYKARGFDRRFGVETAETVPVEQLDYDAGRKAHAVEYDPTSSTDFALTLASLRLNFAEYTFVDLGSGKGRVLLMASEFPFRKVVGVELSAALHAVAERNIAGYRSRTRKCREVQSIHGDATECVFPATPFLLYLFNPFDADLLRRTLDRLESSLRDQPRQAVVIYHNPVHRRLFDESDRLREIGPAADDDWAIYQSRP